MKIIFIRHGQTEATEKGLYCGQSDLPLSAAGRAALLPENRRFEYPDITGYRIITSGMIRTEETLRLIYGDRPHEAMPEFREINFGDFELRHYQELKTDPVYQEWIKDAYNNVCPNGESRAQVVARVTKKLDEVIADGRDALIIAHGGVIPDSMEYLFKEGKNLYEWMPDPGNGYIAEIEVAEEGVRPLSYRRIAANAADSHDIDYGKC